MTVRRITTLGCHPILLLKKMAAISGVTILKEEKWTYSGKEYPYRVVAQIGENLFVETLDPIYRQANAEVLLPNVDLFNYSASGGTWSSTSNPAKLEAVESDKGSKNASPFAQRCYIRSEADIIFDDVALSVLAAPAASPTAGYCDIAVYGYSLSDYLGMFFAGETPSSGFSFETSGDAYGFAYASYIAAGGGIGARKLPGVRISSWPSGVTAPFVVCQGGLLSAMTFPSVFGDDSDTSPAQKGVMLAGTGYPKLLVVSGTVCRVATSVSDNELVNPSGWNPLPIFGSLIANDAGLFFLNGPGASYSGVLGITTIDTSFGGGMSGTFPAVWKSFRRTSYNGAQEGEIVRVLGDEGSPTNFLTMNVFATIPPISSDSVTGGPVCARILAYNSSEIRGAIRGILSAPTAVAMGTSGRVSGTKYAVQLTGRMIQVG